jgi:hypothetical protein
MRQPKRSFVHTSLAAVLTLAAAAPAPAWAQDDEEPEAPATSGEDSQGAPAAPAAEEPASTIPGWFRFDVDTLGPQFWFGATHKIGGLSLASDIYVDDFLAELDLGVALTFGSLSLTPMVGITFDFQNYKLANIAAPQLFITYIQDKLYFDSWIQGFFYSPFDDAGRDYLYFRAFLVYKLFESFGIGPQVEATFFLNESADGAGDDGLSALPVGAQFQVGYGKNSTLGLFLGYDTQYEGEGDSITGRFTFIQTW